MPDGAVGFARAPEIDAPAAGPGGEGPLPVSREWPQPLGFAALDGHSKSVLVSQSRIAYK